MRLQPICFLSDDIGTDDNSAAGTMLRFCRKRHLSVAMAGKKVNLVKLTFCLTIIGKAAFYLWVLYAAAGAIWGGGKGDGNNIDCEEFAKRHFE